jgi:hypothetical protein
MAKMVSISKTQICLIALFMRFHIQIVHFNALKVSSTNIHFPVLHAFHDSDLPSPRNYAGFSANTMYYLLMYCYDSFLE